MEIRGNQQTKPMERFWIITIELQTTIHFCCLAGKLEDKLAGNLESYDCHRVIEGRQWNRCICVYVCVSMLAWHECWLRGGEIANMYIPYCTVQYQISNRRWIRANQWVDWEHYTHSVTFDTWVRD